MGRRKGYGKTGIRCGVGKRWSLLKERTDYSISRGSVIHNSGIRIDVYNIGLNRKEHITWYTRVRFDVLDIDIYI